jgi:hypothetical protein
MYSILLLLTIRYLSLADLTATSKVTYKLYTQRFYVVNFQ